MSERMSGYHSAFDEQAKNVCSVAAADPALGVKPANNDGPMFSQEFQ